MEPDYRAIGKRVRKHREAKGYTQMYLAELTNLAPTSISHIERGTTKASLPTVIRIANALDVSVDDLLCDSLVKAGPALTKEISEALSNCSDEELKLMTRALIAFKNGMDNT